MAKQPKGAATAGADSTYEQQDETTPAAAEEQLGGETPPAPPRPPQGIVIRLMKSGNVKKDFHPYFRSIQMIDPASLVVAGQDPFLALPLPAQPGETVKFRIRQFPPKHAAELLTCDRSTGGPPTIRLATDAEVAQYRREEDARRRK